jgi:hypothetical protein
MTCMTATEVENLVRGALTTAGLWQVVNQYESQFLEFPDGFFAEIVLNDGSKLVDVERVLRDVEGSLRKQGTEVNVIVRSRWNVERVESIWKVESVEHIGTAGASIGRPRLAETFEAILVSGGQRTTVTVNVTHPVWLGIVHRSPASPPEPEFGAIDTSTAEQANTVKDFVIQFLRLRLSLGGANYWDPVREPILELNETALEYLTGHSSVSHDSKG